MTEGANTATIEVTVAVDGKITIDKITKHDSSATDAGIVSAQIAALSPGPVTPADVQAARDAFDALTPAQQALVTNLADLVIAETSAAKVLADKATVDVTYATTETFTTVKNDVTLVAAVTQGSTVTWVSSNSAITDDGTVTRPIFSDGDVTGDVTATIKHGTVQDTKVFAGLTVLKKDFKTTTPVDHTFEISPDGYELTDFTVETEITLDNGGERSGINFEISYDSSTGEATVTAVSGTVTGAGGGTLGIRITKDGREVVKQIKFNATPGTLYDAITFTLNDLND